MKLTAIDPGPTQSAYVVLADGRPVEFGKVPNDQLLAWLTGRPGPYACEQVRSYGMPVGAEVFDTVRWSGKLEQRALDTGSTWEYLPRLEVKLHVCHSARANDAAIRQALVDRFGGKGTKREPGTLYGFKADAWQALALAVTVWDRRAA